MNIVPFITFLICLLVNKHLVGRWISLSNFIIGIYCLSTLCFFIMSFFGYEYRFSLKALLLILIPILLFVKPLRDFERNNVQILEVSPIRIRNLSIFLIVVGLFSCAFFVKNIGAILSMNINDVRNDHITLYESSLFSKLAVLGAFCSPISLFIYFYNKTKNCILVSKFTSLLLLFSSASFIFYTLNVAGRDGIVIWLFVYVSLFCLFYPYLNSKFRRNSLKLLIYACILVIPVFIFISNSRFSDTDDGTGMSIIYYMGHQLDTLTHNINVYESTGIRNANIFAILELPYVILRGLGVLEESVVNTFDRMDENFLIGYRANEFSYFVGSFYPYQRFVVLVLFILCCYMVYSQNLQSRRVSIANVLVAFVWYLIPIVGVFYFYYGSVVGNFFLIMVFVVKLYLKNRMYKI